MVSIILAIVLTLAAAGGGTAYASQASLPGDALYSVKLGTEQMRMTLPGDDIARAERALIFAERRAEEMEALAQRGRAQHLGLAAEKYYDAMNTALARMERAGAGNITALVAQATERHLSVLDRVDDMVPDEAKDALTRAREVAQTGRENALTALARNNPGEATQFNLAAMEGRLNRVRERAMAGDMEGMEAALDQFEAMAEFGEEISRIAQEVATDIDEVEQLIAEATSIHLKVLAEVWEGIPEPARPVIEEAMARAQIRHEKRVQAMERRGIEVSPLPDISPELLRERVEERIGQTKPLWPNIPGGGTPSARACPSCRR